MQVQRQRQKNGVIGLKLLRTVIEVLDSSLEEKKYCVSHHVYEYIEECTTYNTAIATLKNLHTKVPNEVFARHVLATAIRVNPTRVPAFSSKAR